MRGEKEKGGGREWWGCWLCIGRLTVNDNIVVGEVIIDEADEAWRKRGERKGECSRDAQCVWEVGGDNFNFLRNVNGCTNAVD